MTSVLHHFQLLTSDYSTQGMVEKWLFEVEQTMVDSVRAVIGNSIAAYASRPRREWVIQWPGQVVICVSSIYWTNEVSEAIMVEGGIQVPVPSVKAVLDILHQIPVRLAQTNLN